MNLRSKVPKVPNLVAKACLCVVCYLWLSEVVRSGRLSHEGHCLLYLKQVLLCAIAVGARSKRVAILAGISGCLSLFFFVRAYSDVLYYLKLQRDLDVYYQAGR